MREPDSLEVTLGHKRDLQRLGVTLHEITARPARQHYVQPDVLLD